MLQELCAVSLARSVPLQAGGGGSLTRIPPGQGFRIMVCGFVGLWFVGLWACGLWACGFVGLGGCGLGFFEKEKVKEFMFEFCQKT